MTAAVTSVDCGSSSPDGDLAAVEQHLSVERVKGYDGELDEALGALATLLLDLHAARRTQGEIPTPTRAADRPDAARRRARRPSPAGGEAA